MSRMLLAGVVCVIWMNARVVLGLGGMLPGYFEALASRVRLNVPGYLGTHLGCSVVDRRWFSTSTEVGPGTTVGCPGCFVSLFLRCTLTSGILDRQCNIIDSSLGISNCRSLSSLRPRLSPALDISSSGIIRILTSIA